MKAKLVEFKVYADSIENARDRIARRLEGILETMPKGKSLVRLNVKFTNTEYFIYNDKDYREDLTETELPKDDISHSEFIDECGKGILSKLRTCKFNEEYCAEVTALFSSKNTWS